MPDYTVHLTDHEDTAFTAYVAMLQDAAVVDPPPFPPVIPVASVEELIASFMTAPKLAILQWYVQQSE